MAIRAIKYCRPRKEMLWDPAFLPRWTATWTMIAGLRRLRLDACWIAGRTAISWVRIFDFPLRCRSAGVSHLLPQSSQPGRGVSRVLERACFSLDPFHSLRKLPHVRSSLRSRKNISILAPIRRRTYVRTYVFIRYSMSRYYVSTMFYILLALLTPLHRGGSTMQRA